VVDPDVRRAGSNGDAEGDREDRNSNETQMGRIDAVRQSVAAIGAPPQATRDATAMLLSLSGLDASWRMHETYGLPIERIPDVIANTVTLIVERLRSQARRKPSARA